MTNIIQKGTASTVRTTAYSLQYSGTFMEIPMLTVTIKSPALIAFAIGDFIVWDYDGLTYTLKELPPVSKQSTANTYGEAFVYEGVKFVSALAEIKYLEFLDVVPSTDITSHFSSLPTFSFYGNVFALIDRLNANLGRLYANWIVEAADVESGDIYDALYTDRDVTIDSPIKVRDALALVYSMWGLGFVYHYDTVTAKHTITIGEYGADTGGFSYGQGNGLYMVGKTITKEDSIVTRLRAYGSTRNMPARYYNTKAILDNRILIQNDPMLYLPNLMIPYTKWGENPYEPDPELAYINCNNADIEILSGVPDTSYAKYGIREQSVYFDGTNNNKEIFPTIEGITSDEMRDAVSGYSGAQREFYISPDVTAYPDGTRLDKIKVIDSTTDDGVIKTDNTYKAEPEFAGDTDEVTMTDRVMTKTFSPIYSATLTSAGEYKVTFTEQSLTAVCTDSLISDGVLRVWIVKDGNRSSLAATITGVAITNGFEFALPELVLTTQKANGLFSIEMDLEVTLSDWHLGDLATVTWTREAGKITYELTKTVPNNTFTIELKQIGFDIFRFLPSAGQIPIISMTSGSCAARQFNITKTTYLPATDSWQLTCVRQKDNSIGQWFPNSNFKINAEDSFVLLNINMPDILIDIAELRLYDEGCKWLKKRKEQQYIYEPKIDEVYMAILAAAGTPEIIKEGMMMPLVDTDLSVPEGTILINSLTVTESEDSVRKFEVVLREDTDTDLLKYINAQAKQVSSSAVSGITNATTATTEPADQTTTVTSLGFTPENIANKTSVISVDSTATQYPNAKAVYDKVAGFALLAGSATQDFAVQKLTMATLQIPKTAPAGMTVNQWHLSVVETGFAGEEPSGGGGVTLFSALSDTALTAAFPYNSGMVGRVPMITDLGSGVYKWRDTLLAISHIDGLTAAIAGKLALHATADAVSGLTITAGASISNSNTGDQTLSGLGGQAALSGTGFVKISGTTISYDNTTYLVSTAKAADSDKLNGQTATYYLAASLKGSVNGLAELDANGFVKNTQLPSYVDDILEGTWINTTTFNDLSSNPYTPETGKIYVDTTTNKTWRWGGSVYAPVSDTLALGETSATAYRGDRGKTAYDHSQIAGGTGVHISDTERTNWGTAYSHSQVGHLLLRAIGDGNADSYFGSDSFVRPTGTCTNFPVTINNGSVILTFRGFDSNASIQLFSHATTGELYLRGTSYGTTLGWYKLFHTGNSNLSTVPWTASTVTMSENINTRLRLPKAAPAGMEATQWYVSVTDTGFAGEEPSGGGGVTLFSALSDTALTTAFPYNSGMVGRVPVLTDLGSGVYKWRDTALAISHITGLQAALDGKQATITANTYTLFAHTGATGAAHGNSSDSVAGFMTAAQYTKLAGIAESANNYVHPTTDGSLHVPATSTTNENKILKAGATAGTFAWATEYSYTHPTTAGNKHIPSGGAAANILIYSADGTAVWGANNYALPTASDSVLGGVKIGANVTITAGVISVATPYSHPATHAASMIDESTTRRFITDTERTNWGAAYSHTSLTSTAHGLGASAFHADNYFQIAGTYLTKVASAFSGDLNTITATGYLTLTAGATNSVISNNAQSILTFEHNDSAYSTQFQMSYLADFYIRGRNVGTYGNWYKFYHSDNSNRSTVAWTASTITATENIFTKLTIPSSAPSEMTAGRWYISIV